mgnify:CR=1 FL=1
MVFPRVASKCGGFRLSNIVSFTTLMTVSAVNDASLNSRMNHPSQVD